MDPAIQRLRAFAIAAVILIHSTMHFTNLTTGFFSTLSLNVLAQFAVPCFFFISGFALTKSFKPDEDILLFYKKRFRRVLPMYLLACFLYGLFFHAGTFGPISYIRSVIFGSAAYHLWFMPVLFQFYLIFPFLLALIIKAETRFTSVKLVAIAFAVQIMGQVVLKNIMAGNDLVELIGNRLCLYYLGYFTLGMVVARAAFSPFGFWTTTPRIYIQAGLYFILCVILRDMAHHMKIENGPSPLWLEIAMTLSYTAFSAAITISLYQFLREYDLKPKLAASIDYIAENAFAIYLFHVLALEILAYFFSALMPDHSFIVALGLFLTTMLVAVGFCRALDFSQKLLRKTA